MTATPATPEFVFGQTLAADYVPEEGGTWIRNMKQGSNQMRLLPAVGTNEAGETVYGPDAWATEREHYDPELGSYACINDHGSKDCIGCKHPAEKVRKRKRNYYVQAIDKDGELRIFKFGATVFKVLQQRHQRAVALKPENRQPLSGRDYFVHRSGSNLKTEYDVESGDPYEAQWPEERLDISAALQESYQEAMARARGEKPRIEGSLPASDDSDSNANPGGGWSDNEPRSTAPDFAKPDPEADSTGAAAEKLPQAEAPSSAPPAKTRGELMAEAKANAAAANAAIDGDLPENPTAEEIAAADTAAVKKWMTTQGVEFPARAGRTKLVEIAQEAAALDPNAPPY